MLTDLSTYPYTLTSAFPEAGGKSKEQASLGRAAFPGSPTQGQLRHACVITPLPSQTLQTQDTVGSNNRKELDPTVSKNPSKVEPSVLKESKSQRSS